MKATRQILRPLLLRSLSVRPPRLGAPAPAA
jgi:hypothetical protein